MKASILLTGSTGFVGSNILKFLLKKNFRIYDILRIKNKNKNFLNKLKKKKNYFPIFYKTFNDLNSTLKKVDIDIVINCATYYSNDNDVKTIQKLIEANIVFCSIILEVLKKKIKKFINFGSMMEYSNGNYFSPRNFYAVTKYCFQKIEEFYKLNNKNIKFYNLKLYETYGDDDKRNKLIPTIINKHKNNKKIEIVSANLRMNFVHIESLTKVVSIIISRKIKEGEYLIKNKKNISIKKMIDMVNRKIKKKIKTKYLSSKKLYNSTSKLKKFPNWNDEKSLEDFLINQIKN
jgi:nucleoside-diphosphate-sugar epimerase